MPLNEATKQNLRRKSVYRKDRTRELPDVCGIYQIETALGKYYIGSSKNVSIRTFSHLRELKNNRHGNAKLQASYNKYGLRSIKVLFICRPSDLRFYEQRALDILLPTLNLSPTADRVEMTVEVRQKIGAALRRRVILTCVSCAKLFRVRPCSKHRRFCSLECAYTSRRGKSRPPWVGTAISKAKVGRGNGLTGKTRPLALRAKISDFMRTQHKRNPEWTATIIARMNSARLRKRITP